MVPGAVQVPADGQPVVLLADHPTTGGYPVVAVVDSPTTCGLRAAATRRRAPVHGSGTWREGEGRVVGPVGRAPARRACPRSRSAPSPRPRPEPQTQPGPISACTTSMPGCPAARGTRRGRRRGSTASSSSLESRRRGPPGSSRPARRRRRRAAARPPEVSRSASRPRASRAMVPASSVGAGRVVERLSVVKSCRRTLIVTVRPERPLLRSRAATSPACRREQPLHQRAVGQVGVVGALDADRLGLPLRDHRPVVLGPGQGEEPVRRAPCRPAGPARRG